MSLGRDLALATLAAVVVAITLALGQIATYPNLEWYAGLAKPPFNPPNGVFAPVWTALYVLMAFAFWRVLRLPGGHRGPIVLFVVQLGLNAAWSWMFFAARNPLLGLVNIVPQVVVVWACVVAFRRLDGPAGLALVPLGAWVSFAALLNASVWWLN